MSKTKLVLLKAPAPKTVYTKLVGDDKYAWHHAKAVGSAIPKQPYCWQCRADHDPIECLKAALKGGRS